MARSLTDLELSQKLKSNQVDRTVLDEAARRIQSHELDHYMGAAAMVSAIHDSPLISRDCKDVVEKTILAVPMARTSTIRLASLAGQILGGKTYTHQEVLSLAALIVSQAIRDDEL